MSARPASWSATTAARSYDVAQIEALYAEKEGKAAAAQQSAEEKAAAEKKTAEGSEWDLSDLSTDWGAEGEGM